MALAFLGEILHRKTRNREDEDIEMMANHMKALTEEFNRMGERLTTELGSVVEELRLTREELKKTREGVDGEHDAD